MGTKVRSVRVARTSKGWRNRSERSPGKVTRDEASVKDRDGVKLVWWR